MDDIFVLREYKLNGQYYVDFRFQRENFRKALLWDLKGEFVLMGIKKHYITIGVELLDIQISKKR